MTAKEFECPALRESLIDVTAHLVAAISLLEKGGKAVKRAAASDRMFDQMVIDYQRSVDRALKVLRTLP